MERIVDVYKFTELCGARAAFVSGPLGKLLILFLPLQGSPNLVMCLKSTGKSGWTAKAEKKFVDYSMFKRYFRVQRIHQRNMSGKYFYTNLNGNAFHIFS